MRNFWKSGGGDISKKIMAAKVGISFFKTPTELWREKYSG
jgi:hypothetical protein